MNRKKKQSLFSTFRQFMDICLDAESPGTLQKIVDEKIFGFGTAVDEKIFGIREVRKLLSNQRKQSRGLVIKWKIKPVSRTITANENTAVFADDLYLSIRAGKATVKMYIRFSVMLNYGNNQWKVIHWHASKPEQVESEKDTWGVENWKQKATELERLVEEKTADLIEKNRELEIETSLERVRTVAMGMKKPDDLLSICEVLFKELQALGFSELRNTLIHTYVDEKNYFVDYDFSDFTGGRISRIPYNSLPFIEKYLKEIRKSKDAFTEIELGGKELEEWKDFRRAGGQIDDPRLNSALALYYYNYSIGVGDVGISTFNPITHEKREILKRFRNVFDLAYRRYIDIQQAEAQAREAQIQLALERVRARTMAMQKSEELPEAANLLFQQVQSLGMPAWSAGYCIWDNQEKTSVTLWMSSEGVLQPPFQLPTTEEELCSEMRKGAGQDKRFHVVEMGGEKLAYHYAYMRTLPGIGEVLDSIIEAGHPLPVFQIMHHAYFSKGFLLFITYEPVPDAYDIFKRFGNVFDQTYTRFLDLQKAEAQAREAQIQLSLERVRARAMAMHNSEELNSLVALLFEELTKLDLVLYRCIIWIFDRQTLSARLWMANSEDKSSAQSYFVRRIDHPYFNAIVNGWKTRQRKWVYELEGENKKTIDHIFLTETELSKLPEAVKKGILGSTHTIVSGSFNNFGFIEASGPHAHTDEQAGILSRFGKVFDLCYTRFLDLQKAEAQAREARIEAALEKVRSRSLAMHKSDELQEVVNTVFERLRELNIEMDSANIAIFKEGTKDFDYWIASPFQIRSASFHMPYIDLPLTRDIVAARESGVEFATHSYSYEVKNEWFEFAFRYTDFKYLEDTRRQFILNAPGITVAIAFSKHTGIQVNRYSDKSLSEGEAEILKRFAKVFEQAYIRFQDLQKAEAQTREAQIEAALERIRARAMAMHHSDELDEVLVVLWEQFDVLGIRPMSAHMTVVDIPNNRFTFRETGKFGNRSFGEQIVDIDAMDIWKEAAEQWRRSEPETLNRLHFPKESLPMVWQVFHQSFSSMPEDSRITPDDYPDGIYHIAGKHPFGYIGINQIRKATEEEEQIVIRFASEFGRAYQRFLDLQKAEAQAREAQIEAALERVRSRTLAMQKSDELAETAAVMFGQLIHLGIAPNRLYIGIIKDENGDIEAWATNEDGSRVSKQFTLNVKNLSVRKIFNGWRENKKSVLIDMQGKELEQYLHYLHDELHVPFKQGLTQKRRVQNIAYFSKGFIGIASPEEQPEGTSALLERFAAVFNLTYTRFNDLKIAEAHAEQAEQDLIAIKEAKQKAEEALMELQVTQKQLIQAEKMASLGELTAGIAHEIQNPLNFVNNFSEVSNELIREMLEEVMKGNFDEVQAIANDVRQNLEKINHHGKRADGIVKGMLQHSRSSSGQKELTDINALADEYLRLAYHGLRAKDKSFNAKFETSFDETVGKISVMPQDIGRVILNLINNAFYAVTERKKQGIAGFEPTVIVSTRRAGDMITVVVKDNGNGIPGKVLDKIFQPFFTTKPTGQGTGLGLSLSYDIVKAHEGELSVSTREGVGTEFTILLPVNLTHTMGKS